MKTWQSGDVLTASEMNRIEADIKAVGDAIPSITHLATKAEIPDISNLAKKSEIPSITHLATKTEVANHITGAEVQDMINAIPPVDLSSYATKSYVTSAINEAVLAGSDIDIDLTPYALATDLNNKVDKVAGKGLSTNDLTNALKTKLEGIEAGAQKNPDLSQYALKSDIKDATQMEFNGVPLEGLRRYIFEVEAVEGEWSIDYSDKGFTQFVTVSFTQ